MELTKEKYLSICEESGFVGAKDQPELNQDNFYLPIETEPCFLPQLTALAFSWYNDECHSHFQRSCWHKITTVEELQNEIERCKKIYEQKCRKVMKKIVAVRKKEIQKASERFEA